MLKPLTITTTLLLCHLFTLCQKEDYVWLQGYNSEYGFDTATNKWLGITKFDFNHQPMQMSYDSLGMYFNRTNVSYCNADGNLLFYSNGIHVRNGIDAVIENADSLNWGPYLYLVYPYLIKRGYLTTQGILALPDPANKDQYYIINTYLDSSATWIVVVDEVRYHVLNMAANAGLGTMVEKNKTILNSILAWEMACVRHGNGRDWWIVVRKWDSNCYHRILISTDGPKELPELYCGGLELYGGEIGAFATSPDGSRIAHLSNFNGVNLFDFDRCNGVLSNPVNIPVYNADTSWAPGGAAFSPNGRFLYISLTRLVLQYDLQAPDIAASVDTVAVYDGHQAPFGSYFYTMQLGPDGKIYESCGNGETVYHVINYPDKKGDSCGFVQHGIDLPSYCLGVPNFPNYRLGTLPGSSCDTLGTSISQLATRNPQLTIFPNPATEFVVIDYATTADWSKGELRLFIYDTKGAVIHEQPLPMYSGFQKITCTQWPSGVYQATIKRRETTIATGRVVKQ
ncbi:MAG: T9SS type A sorting domain-containing protein [Chitinophagales bacterium]|nr:T9SS type A sorting domain-containing protein [Chitinophagales bacterium]